MPSFENIIKQAKEYEFAVNEYRQRDIALQPTDWYDSDDDEPLLLEMLMTLIDGLGTRSEVTKLTDIHTKLESLMQTAAFEMFADTPETGWYLLGGLIEQYINPLSSLTKVPAEQGVILNRLVQFNERVFVEQEISTCVAEQFDILKAEIEKISTLDEVQQANAEKLCSTLSKFSVIFSKEGVHISALRKKFEPLKTAIDDYARDIASEAAMQQTIFSLVPDLDMSRKPEQCILPFRLPTTTAISSMEPTISADKTEVPLPHADNLASEWIVVAKKKKSSKKKVSFATPSIDESIKPLTTIDLPEQRFPMMPDGNCFEVEENVPNVTSLRSSFFTPKASQATQTDSHVTQIVSQATQTEPMKKLSYAKRLEQASLLKLMMTLAYVVSTYHDHQNDSNMGKISCAIGAGIMLSFLYMIREDIAANTEEPTEQEKCFALFMS